MILLLACSSSDPQLFAQAALVPSLAEGVPICDRIVEPGLRSECLASLVREHGAEDLEAAVIACDGAPDEAWRDECRFALAEVALRARGHETATALCTEAGRFQGQCLKHLWDKEAARLKRELPLDEAVGLYAADLDRVAVQDEQLLSQAWGVFFRSELPLSGPLRIEDCAGLPGQHPARCRAGLREAVKRHVGQAVAGRGAEAYRGACRADSADQRADIVQELAVFRYEPRGLDAFVREGLAEACR